MGIIGLIPQKALYAEYTEIGDLVDVGIVVSNVP